MTSPRPDPVTTPGETCRHPNDLCAECLEAILLPAEAALRASEELCIKRRDKSMELARRLREKDAEIARLESALREAHDEVPLVAEKARREALEEACKAMCPLCWEGRPLELDLSASPAYCWRHPMTMRPENKFYCDASPIRRALSEPRGVAQKDE